MDIFLYASCAVIYNLMRPNAKPELQKHCMAVLDVTATISRVEVSQTPDFERLRHTLVQEHKGLPKDLKYTQVFQSDVKKICKFLESATDVEKWPDFDISASASSSADYSNEGWQNVDAPFIWEWVHIVTIHLDLNAGMAEKTNFVVFLQNSVGCSICHSHYGQHMPRLIAALVKLSLTDVYLILHTTIAREEIDGGQFDAKNLNYIDARHKKRFFEQYCAIRGPKRLV